MTEEQKILSQKKRAGTLTEVEYDRYLELLRNDRDFREDTKLDELIENVLQQEADERRWNDVEAALNQRKQTQTRVVALRQRAFWAVAASLVGVAVGIWWWNIQFSNAPQLLSNRATEIFVSDSSRNGGRAFFSGNLPMGALPTQWQLKPNQANAIDYLYCQDTLRLYVKTKADTLKLLEYGLLYNQKTKKLFLKTTLQKTIPLDSCRVSTVK